MADTATLNLFDDPKLQPSSKPELSTALVIRARDGRKLSREQRNFNRLTKRIAELERSLVLDRERLDRILVLWQRKVEPIEQLAALGRIDLARALATAYARFKLNKRHKKTIRPLILALLDEAFCVEKPDAGTEALYDDWAETSYREEVRQQVAAVRQGLAEEVKSRFGVEPDLDGETPDEDDSPEAMARLLSHLREKIREAEASGPDATSGRRRRSKRGSLEAEIEAREALSKKSVRAVYLSLAKVLHPDAVVDAEERALREDHMKQAAFAYREGNLAELLRLQRRWVNGDDAAIESLSDDTLGAYLPALHRQVETLEFAIRSQMLDPHYFSIGPVVHLTEKSAGRQLRVRANALKADVAEIEEQQRFVERCTSSKDLLRFVRSHVDAMEAERDLDGLLADMMMEADDWE